MGLKVVYVVGVGVPSSIDLLIDWIPFLSEAEYLFESHPPILFLQWNLLAIDNRKAVCIPCATVTLKITTRAFRRA